MKARANYENKGREKNASRSDDALGHNSVVLCGATSEGVVSCVECVGETERGPSPLDCLHLDAHCHQPRINKVTRKVGMLEHHGHAVSCAFSL